MYRQIGHRPTIAEAFMQIGIFVQKKGSKGSLGVIMERPPIAGCWKVKWTRGKNQGSSSLIQEVELETVETKT